MADQQTRTRNRTRLEVAAVRRQAGGQAAKDVVVRLSVRRTEEDRAVGRMTVVLDVALVRRPHLVAAACSPLVGATAAPYCHFAGGRGCDFDCAMECADCDCDCG